MLHEEIALLSGRTVSEAETPGDSPGHRHGFNSKRESRERIQARHHRTLASVVSTDSMEQLATASSHTSQGGVPETSCSHQIQDEFPEIGHFHSGQGEFPDATRSHVGRDSFPEITSPNKCQDDFLEEEDDIDRRMTTAQDDYQLNFALNLIRGMSIARSN